MWCFNLGRGEEVEGVYVWWERSVLVFLSYLFPLQNIPPMDCIGTY
jgi:hypothetical protein